MSQFPHLENRKKYTLSVELLWFSEIINTKCSAQCQMQREHSPAVVMLNVVVFLASMAALEIAMLSTHLGTI
jgi:hypothetical protein